MTRPLTEKQKGVCRLVAEGLSNKQISVRLGISHRTVESHRMEIYRKLGVHNAVQLVRHLFSEEGNKVHG